MEDFDEDMKDFDQTTETRLSPPWVTYTHMLEALFERDPDVVVTHSDDFTEVEILVEGQVKADALSRLIPESREFGNVAVKTAVIPANGAQSVGELFNAAFFGNEAFSGIIETSVPVMGDVTYALFTPGIAQFFNDDISDAHGVCTMTYEQIAEDVIRSTAYICSDLLDEQGE